MANDNPKSSDTIRAVIKMLKAGKSNKELQPYLKKARWIPHSIHPFLNIQRIFYAGVPEEVLNDEEAAEEEYSDEERKAFEAIMKLERGFREVVDACAPDMGMFAELIKQVNSAATHSRSDDIASLKSRILDYIYEDPKKGSHFPADLQSERLLSHDSKEFRGFRNIDTADLLCPLRLKAEFEEDPIAFMERVEDGEIEITADDLLSFLYESGTVYDPENEMIGLFRGFLLVRVFRHIFTGPKSALGLVEHGRNKNKAGIYQMKAVDGRTIAYTCVLTYLGLSTMKRWGTSDALFHLDEFYNNIIEIFEENAGTPWVEETLEWWNSQIPGLRSKSRRAKATTRPVPKQALVPAAKRIAAQLAGQGLKRPLIQAQQTSLHNEDPVEKEWQDRFENDPLWNDNAMDDNSGDEEDFDSADEVSLTEPDSSDEEAHQIWEKREEARQKRLGLKRKRQGEYDSEEEYQRAERRRTQEERHQDEYRQEERHRPEERHQQERHQQEELRQEERRQEQRRQQEELRQEERRQEQRRQQEELRQEQRRQQEELRQEERRQERRYQEERQHQQEERRKEAESKTKKVSWSTATQNKATTRSSTRRAQMEATQPTRDETSLDLELSNAKRLCQSQPAKFNRKY